MTHTLNASTHEAEAGKCLWVWGQLGIHSEFQNSQSFTVRPSQTQNRTKQNKKALKWVRNLKWEYELQNFYIHVKWRMGYNK